LTYEEVLFKEEHWKGNNLTINLINTNMKKSNPRQEKKSNKEELPILQM